MEDVSEKLNRVRDTVVKSNLTKYKSTDIITISDLVLIFTNNDVPCDLVCAVADILSINDSKFTTHGSGGKHVLNGACHC